MTDIEECLPKTIKLINRNEYIKCRKVKAVVGYHTPNKKKKNQNYIALKSKLIQIQTSLSINNNLVILSQLHSLISMHLEQSLHTINQPSEISDDMLRQFVTQLTQLR